MLLRASPLIFLCAACSGAAFEPPKPQLPQTQKPASSPAIAPARAQASAHAPKALSAHSLGIALSHPTSGTLPNLGGSGLMFYSGGRYMAAGTTSPGSVSYDQAPIFDDRSGPGTPPSVFGGGNFQVAFGAYSFSATAAQSLSGVFSDMQSNTQYVVLGAYHEVADPSAPGRNIGTAVYVIAPLSDFGVGNTVMFDGQDRVALVMSGHVDLQQPEVAGIAVSGSVTYTAGGTNVGDTISANAQGNFSETMVMQGPPPPPPPPPGMLTAGSYMVTFSGPPQVNCSGALAGHESDFASVTLASSGFTSGRVTLAVVNANEVTLDGAAMTASYGQTPFKLDQGTFAPPGIFAGEVDRNAPGPAGTQLGGALLALDSSGASPSMIQGFAALGYGNPMGAMDDVCQVSFDVTLTP
jgi:hypothetical protein